MLGLQATTCQVHFAVVVGSVVPLPDRKLPGVLVPFVCRLPRSRRTQYSHLCCEKELKEGGRWKWSGGGGGGGGFIVDCILIRE